MDPFHINSHYFPPYHENDITHPLYCHFQSQPQVIYSQYTQNAYYHPTLAPLNPIPPNKKMKTIEAMMAKMDENLLGLQV